jgi:hypothetical protein
MKVCLCIISSIQTALYAQLTKINAHIYLRCVPPNVIPNVVSQELRSATAFGSRNSREDTVDVGERSTCASCKVVSLVHVDTHWVYSWEAND